jgi:hypothetical protein
MVLRVQMTLSWQYNSTMAPNNSSTQLGMISQQQGMAVLGVLLLLLLPLAVSPRLDALLEPMLAGRVPTSAGFMVLVSIARNKYRHHSTQQ